MHPTLCLLSFTTLLISPLVVAGQHAANTGIAAALQRQAHTFSGKFQFINEMTGEKLIYEVSTRREVRLNEGHSTDDLFCGWPGSLRVIKCKGDSESQFAVRNRF